MFIIIIHRREITATSECTPTKNSTSQSMIKPSFHWLFIKSTLSWRMTLTLTIKISIPSLLLADLSLFIGRIIQICSSSLMEQGKFKGESTWQVERCQRLLMALILKQVSIVTILLYLSQDLQIMRRNFTSKWSNQSLITILFQNISLMLF